MGKYRDQNVITIKSKDDRYISAQPSGAVVLSREAKETEEFIVCKVSKKSVNLKTHFDTVLHFHEDGSVEHHKITWTDTLTKISSKPTDFHVDIIKTKPHHCGFRNAFGKYVAVKPEEPNLVTSKFLDENAMFEIQVVKQCPKVHKSNKIKDGKWYQIKTNQKMFFVVDEDFHIRQVTTPSDDTCDFQFSKKDDHWFIKSRQGKYLMTTDDGIVKVGEVEEAELFDSGETHGKLGLKSVRTGKYLSSKKDGTIKLESTLKSNEEFELFKRE